MVKYSERILTHTYQIVEYVSLMEVNCDESLILDPVNLLELFCCHLDERVKYVQEVLVSLCHYLPVRACMLECVCGISRPYDLQP